MQLRLYLLSSELILTTTNIVQKTQVALPVNSWVGQLLPLPVGVESLGFHFAIPNLPRNFFRRLYERDKYMLGSKHWWNIELNILYMFRDISWLLLIEVRVVYNWFIVVTTLMYVTTRRRVSQWSCYKHYYQIDLNKRDCILT